MSQKAEVGWKKLIEVIELTNTSSLQVNDAIITAFVKNSQELTAVVRRRVSKLSSVNVFSDFLTCIFSNCSPVSNWLAIAISNSLSLSWETTTPCQLIRFASISTPCKLRLCFDLELDVLYKACIWFVLFLSVGYGLKHVTATARLSKNGPNLVIPPADWPWWCKLVLVHFSGFAPLLWVATFLVFLSWQPFGTPPTNLYNLILAIVLMAVIVISSMFTFYQVSSKCVDPLAL